MTCYVAIAVRPQMPTAQVVQKYDQLHHSLVHMLELRKTVDKMEAEQRARMQRGGHGGGAAGSGSRVRREKRSFSENDGLTFLHVAIWIKR